MECRLFGGGDGVHEVHLGAVSTPALAPRIVAGGAADARARRTCRSAPYFGLTVTEIVFGLSCWLSISVDAPGADVTVAPVAETV